jgi:copper chaperone
MALIFSVPDMTCGHCAKTITEAVQQASPNSLVQIDVSAHTVTVSGENAAAIQAAIVDAGYTPRAL